MPSANALIGQSGGPTSVINSSLVGVVDAAKKSKAIARVFGMRFGIEGVLNDFLLDLSGESAETLKAVRQAPSSALGSSRLKLKDEHLPQVIERLKQCNIRYLFMIGGNDTMDTIHRVTDYAAKNGYDLQGIGVPKTVDNDLYGTHFAPGFPSAARYVALSVLQGGRLARDMQRVDQFTIFQTVGRSAGWLPAAAALARAKPADPPHVILMPERPFVRDAFLASVKKAHEQYGFCSIICGEGITHADGTPVSASETRDKFNNIEFGAMGGTSAAMMLHRLISNEFGWRGEFQVTESLSMCAADRAVKLDLDLAYGLGREAARLALEGNTGVMVTLKPPKKVAGVESFGFGTAPLSEVANHARPLPDKFIGADGMSVTKACLAYLKPLVGELPEYGSLTIKKAKKS